MAYGKAEVTSNWRPYKARPAPTDPLGRRFNTGTSPYELLAGFNATIDYLDSIGGFEAIVPYERALGDRFLGYLRCGDGLWAADDGGAGTDVPGQRRWRGGRRRGRAPGGQDIGVWAHDSWYSLNLYKRLGYEKDAIRIGFIHYNTVDEVDRLVAGLEGARG